MYTALDVANFFVDMFNTDPENHITNLHVNKLIYFAQGCSLARNGRPLFPEEFRAYPYGPVVKQVYDAFAPCGRNPISSCAGEYNPSIFSADDLDLLVDVYNEYGQYNSSALVSMTHQPDTPWSSVYEEDRRNLIPNESIRNYFLEHPLKTFSFVPSGNTPGYRDPADGRLVLPVEYAE